MVGNIALTLGSCALAETGLGAIICTGSIGMTVFSMADWGDCVNPTVPRPKPQPEPGCPLPMVPCEVGCCPTLPPPF